MLLQIADAKIARISVRGGRQRTKIPRVGAGIDIESSAARAVPFIRMAGLVY